MEKIIVKAWYDQWISKRREIGLFIEDRPYQFEKLYEMICTPTGRKFVLAAAPSAGKTLMAILYIEWRLHINPDYKILVLPHGLSDLRIQFKERIENYQADFTGSPNIIIELPHSVNPKRKDLQGIDEIIVDEAHQFYFAEDGMVKEIIKRYKPKREMLLTGSPHDFIRANKSNPNSYIISIIDAFSLWKLEILQDVLVEVASTTYNFDFKKDFNASGDLFQNVAIPTVDIKKAMADMMEKILFRLRSRFKNNPEAYKKYLENGTFENFFLTRTFKDSIGKTMIACRNIAEATAVNELIVEYGYGREQIVQSTSNITRAQSPKEESLIVQFKTNPDIKFLVVVYNGVLGFDYPELCNVIDLTCSRNVARLYQLYCRLVRRSEEKMDKFYYKVVPYDLVFFFERLMEGVLHLGHEHFLKLFDGKNFFQIPVVRRSSIPKGIQGTKRGPKGVGTSGDGISFSSIFEMIKLSHTGNDSIDSKSYVTLNYVMHSLGMSEKMDWKSMSDEELLEAAKKYLP